MCGIRLADGPIANGSIRPFAFSGRAVVAAAGAEFDFGMSSQKGGSMHSAFQRLVFSPRKPFPHMTVLMCASIAVAGVSETARLWRVVGNSFSTSLC